MLQNEVRMNEYGVEEIIKVNDVTMERSSQDKMTDMFINNDVKIKRSSQDQFTDKFINSFYNKDVKFLSSFIKYASMSWKGNCYLNFGKQN